MFLVKLNILTMIRCETVAILPRFLQFDTFKSIYLRNFHWSTRGRTLVFDLTNSIRIRAPRGLYRTDGKRPDGVAMIPWEMGKRLVWDVTVVDAFAPSCLNQGSLCNPGTRHGNKFERITSNFNFELTSFEFSKNRNKFESLCSNFELRIKRASDISPFHLVPRGPLGPLMFPSF